jgi:acyl-CoA synthetase (AMP-forming)/AMP-acid ligase II
MAPLGLLATMVRAGIIAPLRPDKYLRIAAVARREGLSVTSGFAMPAQRCPNGPALIDELGTLTYRQLDQRGDALAFALQGLPGGTPEVVAIICRNHRGFVEALVAANRIGADVLLLNTSFAGPALADVVNREGADAVIYDEEFTDSVDRALVDKPNTTRIVAWTDHPETHETTVETLIAAHTGRRPAKADRKGKLILLTSGTTGNPKGAKHSGGGATELQAILDRVPWHTEETTVVVAPMFHARQSTSPTTGDHGPAACWGFLRWPHRARDDRPGRVLATAARGRSGRHRNFPATSGDAA